MNVGGVMCVVTMSKSFEILKELTFSNEKKSIEHFTLIHSL